VALPQELSPPTASPRSRWCGDFWYVAENYRRRGWRDWEDGGTMWL